MRDQSSHLNEDSDKREASERNASRADRQTAVTVPSSSVQFPSRQELSLHELLRLCLQSKQEVLWAEFVRRSHPVIAGVIVKTIRRWTRPDPGLVDDIVQETYLRLCLHDFRALRQFISRHENSIFGFLKVVASNAVQDHFRAVFSQKRGHRMTFVPLQCVPLTELTAAPPDMERSDRLLAVDDCLEAHAAGPNFSRDRMIFWLHYREGLTAKEISGLPIIGLSAKGVEGTIRRLAHLLRVKLNS
jgi:RNA polymerase sigma-70 factor (ECF subfamily)